MRKFIIFIINLLILITPVICGSFDYLHSGEYAYYLDKRGNLSFFRGYLFFSLDSGEYIVVFRNVNLSDKKEINYIVWLKENDGEITISQTNGLSDSTPAEYRQGFVDFVKFHFMYQKNKQDINFGSIIEETGDNYTLVYNYNRLLPFFQFLDISEKGDLEPFYILNTAGIINDKNINDFFNIAPVYLEEKPRSVQGLKIPIKKSKKVSIDCFSTELDENWNYNNALGGPGYWLNFNTYRDSQITVESIPPALFEQEGFNIEKICKAAILSSQKVDYKSVAGFYEKDLLYVSFSLLDPNDIKNYQFLFIKNNKLINFSTFADVFDANKEYYQKIINKMIQ